MTENGVESLLKVELDDREVRERLRERGLEGEELEGAHRTLTRLARELAGSRWPPSRRVEIWESRLDALAAPADLQAALVAFEAKLVATDREWLRDLPETELPKLDLTWGAWIRTRWCASPESRLVVWFRRRGVHEPHDISSIVLASFHRHLNGRPVELDAQLEMMELPSTAQALIERRDDDRDDGEDHGERMARLGAHVITVPTDE